MSNFDEMVKRNKTKRMEKLGLMRPVAVYETLINEGFTEDQAASVAAQIYQPIYNFLSDYAVISSTGASMLMSDEEDNKSD